MKRTLLVAAAALLLGPLGIQSDEGMHKGMSAEMKEKKLERMTQELGLSTDQRDMIKAAMDQKQAKVEEAQSEYQTKLNSILTPEQRTKHEEMKAKMKEKMEDRKEKRKK